MLSYKLTDFSKIESLVTFCRRYNEDIDLIFGRQIIDGKSIIGAMSLVGHLVGVEILTNDSKVKEEFAKEFAEYMEE